MQQGVRHVKARCLHQRSQHHSQRQQRQGRCLRAGVCKTPIGNAIVPVPYPNVAESSTLKNGSKSVMINGQPAALKDSHFKSSRGDEAGRLGGVVSGTTGSIAEFVSYSFDVKIEGRNVVRHADMTTHNKGNTLGMVYGSSSPAPAIASTIANEAERKCPKCGAILKKTEPTLAQVRNAVAEVSVSHRNDIKAYAADAAFGYLGSVATGKVGNEEKPHYGLEPDIRGECKTYYDIDGLIISERAKTVRKRWGKRWASSNQDAKKLEAQIRSSLQSRSELRYMKKGKDAFSIVLYLPSEQPKVVGKGCRITVS